MDQSQFLKTPSGWLFYFKKVEKSQYCCVIIPDHFGINESLIQNTSELVKNNISIIIPDLLNNIKYTFKLEDKTDSLEVIKFLKYSFVLKNIKQCINLVKKTGNKKFILIGYSIGSAYALKILEQIHDFQHSYAFYGLPDIKKFNPIAIKTNTTIFYGTQDRIKYLSDLTIVQQAIQLCKENPLIKFQCCQDCGHGFMNMSSDQFNITQYQRVIELILQDTLKKKTQQQPLDKISESSSEIQKKQPKRKYNFSKTPVQIKNKPKQKIILQQQQQSQKQPQIKPKKQQKEEQSACIIF